MRLARAAWALAAGVVLAAHAAEPAPPTTIGTGADALSAVDPSTGETVRLDPAEGPLHLVFLATWCRPCLAEIPRLFDLEDRWKQDGYRLILIALPTRQSPERLKEFLVQGPVPGRLLFDGRGSVSAACAIASIPTHLLVERSGRIVARSTVLDAAFTASVERLVRQEGRVKP